jgi:hypothetical protein
MRFVAAHFLPFRRLGNFARAAFFILAFRDLLTPAKQHRNFAAHIAYAGDAVCNQEGQDNVPSTRKPVSKSAMNVHVPQAWNQKLAFAIDNKCIGRNLKMG